MIDLEKTYGPLTARVWGLVLNFFANAMALYGAVHYVSNGSHAVLLVLGAVGTLACILVLARPSA